ncbi:MAG TPA: hypothetical protein VFI06_08860 [Chitinophagaceae bacterium]|nr:hypothetical protein [Chitinophagaceae bacterium]
MFKFSTLFAAVLFSTITHAQNIYSALHLNDEREYKTARPKKILETNTFFNSSGKQVDKNIKTFDEAGMLLLEERYDESGTLKARLTYTNDTVNRLTLTRTFERWTQIGYSKETAFYSYDSNKFLIATTDRDPNGNTLMQTNLICNDKGHPIQLSLFDGNGNPYGKEIATYLYEKNKVVTSVISNEGAVLSTDTIKISFKEASLFPSDREVYNSNGDLTSWTRRNLDQTETIFEEEFTYDKFGNCTENIIYKVTVKENGKRKKKKDRIFKKEYKY